MAVPGITVGHEFVEVVESVGSEVKKVKIQEAYDLFASRKDGVIKIAVKPD